MYHFLHLTLLVPPHLHLGCLMRPAFCIYSHLLLCLPLYRKTQKAIKSHFPDSLTPRFWVWTGPLQSDAVTQWSANRNEGEAVFQLCLFPVDEERCADMDISTFQYKFPTSRVLAAVASWFQLLDSWISITVSCFFKPVGPVDLLFFFF